MRENGDCFFIIELIVNYEKWGVVFMYFLYYGIFFYVMGVVVMCVNVGDFIYIFKIFKYGLCNYKESVIV